jgi:hypothetical protein
VEALHRVRFRFVVLFEEARSLNEDVIHSPEDVCKKLLSNHKEDAPLLHPYCRATNKMWTISAYVFQDVTIINSVMFYVF